MVIATRSTSTVSLASRTNTSITAPAGAVTGDLIEVSMTVGGSASVTPTAPAGWTLVASTTMSASDPWTVNHYLYIKFFDGAAPWTFTHSSASTQAFTRARTGVDGTTPVDVAASTISNAPLSGATATVLPSITTVTNDAMLSMSRASWDGNAITPPVGVTETSDTPVLWTGEKLQTTAGSTGSISVPHGNGSNNYPNAGILYALRPDTGGSPVEGSGSGAVSWAGSSTGSRITAGLVVGALVWGGAVTGATVHAGSAAGATSWGGSATGAQTPVGSANGMNAFTSSGTGVAPVVGAASGNISGAVGWAGTSTGNRVASGASSGTILFGGSATGSTPTIGGATGASIGGITWAGSSLGATQPIGTSTGALSWAGMSTGTILATGTTAATFVFVGTVTGGNIQRNITITGTPLPDRWAVTSLGARFTSTPLPARWSTSSEVT